MRTRNPRLPIAPTTSRGRSAVALSALFWALILAGTIVPRGAALGLACGAAGGMLGLLAVVRDRERALSVFVALVPLAIAVAFVLAVAIGGSS
jgi:hypothetical protein